MIACDELGELSCVESKVARHHVCRVPATETEVRGASNYNAVEYTIVNGKMIRRDSHVHGLSLLLRYVVFGMLVVLSVCFFFCFRFGDLLSPLVLLDIMRRREKRHDECSMGRNRTSK